MELAQQWLEAQRGTPSFVAAGPGESMAASFGVVDASRHGDRGGGSTILDAPLPAGLLSVTPTRSNATSTHGVRLTHRSRSGTAAHVHEDLIAKGKLYQQRREARQERAVRDELKAVRGPKISQEAKNLHHDRPYHERVRRQQDLRREQDEAKLETIRREEDAAAKKLNTFKPKLSSRGRRATSKVHMMLADQHDQWQSRREEGLEAERAKRVVEELQSVRDGPEINARSQRLAARRREKEGVAGMSHAEAMLERDRLSKLALWERQQKEAMLSNNPNPRITTYAATLERGDEDPGDRLYRAAFEAAERKAERARLSSEAQHRSPRISGHARRSQRSRSATRIEDDLMERHLQSLAHREHAALESERRQRQDHVPAINPVSDAIAAQLPQSSRERLVEPRRSASHADPMDGAAASLLSAPRSDAGTGRSVSARGAGGVTQEERAEILARQEERRRQRMEQLRWEAEERELRECTFAPATGAGQRRATTPTPSLAERSANWAKKREQWRSEQQRAQASAEVAECTFAPETHSNANGGQDRGTPHRSIYGGSGRAWGADEFIERQKQARERQEQERDRQTRTGSQWKNRPTVPQEPALGRSTQRSRISALEQPIAPPRYESHSPPRESYYPPQPAPHAGGDSRHHHGASQARESSSVPERAHFSQLRHGEAQPMKPLVPFTLHQHRAAFGPSDAAGSPPRF